MEGKTLTLKCPVTVKAIVTEELKAQMATEMQDAIKKIDIELQQIEFQGKRIMAEQVKVDAQRLPVVREQIEAEKEKRMEVKGQILEQLKQAAELEVGAEIVQGTLERFIEVSVGDDLHTLMSTEIVVKDGKIVDIRM